jgi:AcrR family transcriptional regulator
MTDTRAKPAVPTRRSRPRDRKDQIVRAAADLFYRRGYHNVGTEQIAQSVGVTAGALYRHFTSKQDLLAHALTDAFDRGLLVVRREAPEDLDALVAGLATTAGERRHLGVLWNRESRHLDDAVRDRLRADFFAFLAEFQTRLRAARPELEPGAAELLAWASLAVLTSPSYHGAVVAPDALIDLLRRMTLAVCTTPLVAPTGQPEDSTRATAGLTPRSRREAILAAATRLFYARGYQATSMDEVGRAVGMTSTGVYKYFDSKAQLLAATIARASEPLHLGLTMALASATSAADGLERALDAYIDFALVHHDLVGILVSEVTNLPDDQRDEARRAQHDYVGEWIQLLAQARPELSEVEARFVVHAVLSVVNDVTRTRSLMQRPGIGDDLRSITRRVLAVDVDLSRP